MATTPIALATPCYRAKVILPLCFLLLWSSGCGFRRAPEVAASAPAPIRTLQPTYTPTAVETAPPVAAATATPTSVLPATATPLTPTLTLSTTVTVLVTVAAVVAPTDTPAAAAPRLTVVNDAVNLRSGPDVAYLLVETVTRDRQFSITGRNPAGDWWQICCVADQPAWIYGPLVSAENAENVAVVTDLPAPPVAVSAPTPLPASPVTESAPTIAPETVPAPPSAPVTSNLAPGVPASHSGTAGNFDASAQYQIVDYRVLGFADNNGGIFNKGSQQLIFLTVLDQTGTPVDGAVVKDAVEDKLNIVTGSKGPGKAEIKMDWDPYKLYVASDPGGPVTSQISNQMNNPHPHLPDVVGLLGPVENEYAVCPTIDDRCEPPFFTIHFSYEITFQRVR